MACPLTPDQHTALTMVIADLRVETNNQQIRIALLKRERDELQQEIERLNEEAHNLAPRGSDEEP